MGIYNMLECNVHHLRGNTHQKHPQETDSNNVCTGHQDVADARDDRRNDDVKSSVASAVGAPGHQAGSEESTCPRWNRHKQRFDLAKAKCPDDRREDVLEGTAVGSRVSTKYIRKKETVPQTSARLSAG